MLEPIDARGVLLPWQRQVLSEARRFNVVNVGRQAGKTELDKYLSGQTAVRDGLPVGYFVPKYSTIPEVWGSLRRRFGGWVAAASKAPLWRIDLHGGGVVEFWTLHSNPDAGRGRRYARVIVDEAAMVADLGSIWRRAILPTLTVYRGDAWFTSTPKGHGDFKQMYDWGQDPGREDWASWRFPSWVNPTVAEAEWEQARRTSTERDFAQEYEAAFIENTGAVFRRIREAATEQPAEPRDGAVYVIGADWARDVDFTAFAVVDLERGALVHLHRSNQVDYAVQGARLAGLSQRYNGATVIAESNAMGLPIIEQLQRDGVPVQAWKATNATKAAAVENLALAFEQGAITILDDPVLIGELQAFTYSRTPSGLVRYEAAAGGHDDTVIALMLAWLGGSHAITGEVLS